MEVSARAGERLAWPRADDRAWFGTLLGHIDRTAHAVGRRLPGPVLSRCDDGQWQAGSVVADLWWGGHRLIIHADQCEPVTAGSRPITASYAAAVWCSAVDEASRHGPPAIHREMSHVGPSLRGRLDARATMQLRTQASFLIASTYRARDLDNPVSRALVAADRTLRRQIGHDRWRTRRVQEILPRLYEAVGRRSTPPTLAELTRIKYSPITLPFREAAQLSCRIVAQDPLTTTVETGRAQGLILDLDEALGLGVRP